jgi:hypothetical protein
MAYKSTKGEKMNQLLDEKMQTLTPGRILEVARETLPPALQIDSLDEGYHRLIELSDLPPAEVKELEELLTEASDCHDDVIAMLKIVMLGAVEDGLVDSGRFSSALDTSGQKLIAISPDTYLLGAMLIAGFIAIAGKGRKETSKEIIIEESGDGRKKITIIEKTHYLDPRSGVLALIEKVLKHGRDV